MKMVAGAILILAASVCFAAGLLADALCTAHGRTASLGGTAYFVSVAVGLIGLGVLFSASIASTFGPTPLPPGNTPRQD